ncbi:TniB family NTP-binding protein [Stenotrophomonas oahuensis]|uniref:TniB family NTP-binding protein n=1 Tax=Stenotrophomonas oahuensis TaxID=3003271 RepID=A0ABY9YMU9_9GAMM|nr:TniB family NTP-binding protein [Stenotrophomonas sp. A5586]WNH52038.1 TniB family NTP-binding protein [Stenotrophomonas sp. A5586]
MTTNDAESEVSPAFGLQVPAELEHSFRFIPHPAAVTYLKLASHLRRFEAGRDRPKCVHLASGPGGGKTRLQMHYLSQVSPSVDALGLRQREVIFVEAPFDGHHSKLARSLIDACLPGGYPVRRPSLMCDTALNLLSSSGVKQILIDEAGNFLNAGRATQQQTLAFIKTITNRGITVSIASTMNLVNVLAADEQLQSRFTRVEIPLWSESQQFRSFLASIEAGLDLPKASGLDDQAVVRWMVSRGCCTTAKVLEVIAAAMRIVHAQKLSRIDVHVLERALTAGYVGEGK